MSKIIVLGDSFAELRPDQDYLWQKQLTKKFKKDLVNIAHNGASSEWMMLKISEYLEANLEQDDFLIVIVPFWERVCIWPEHPDFNANFPLEATHSDWTNCVDELPPFISERMKTHSLEERKAFESYFKYLKNDQLVLTKTAAMLNWVNNISYNLDKKPLILDSHRFIEHYPVNLNNCTVAKGNLFSICAKEFESEKAFKEYTNSGPFNDFRTGHFSECNHSVMTDKIYDYFTNGITPDLSKDFFEKIIQKETVKTKGLLQKVLDLI